MTIGLNLLKYEDGYLCKKSIRFKKYDLSITK